MSAEQRENLEAALRKSALRKSALRKSALRKAALRKSALRKAALRKSALPVGSDVNEQRQLLRELMSAQPLPADVTVTAAALGGVATAEITVDGVEPRHVVLYFHGGVYVMGDAARRIPPARNASPHSASPQGRTIITRRNKCEQQ